MSVCHAEKVVTDLIWTHRRPACSFISSNTFFPPESSPRAFIWRSVTAASLSSLGPAPRLQSLGSLPSLPACPHACAALVFCSITLKVLRRPWVAVAMVAHQVLPRAAPSQPSPCPPPVEAHLLCLAACANVTQGDRFTLILSLAQSWSQISGIFHLRISISGV